MGIPFEVSQSLSNIKFKDTAVSLTPLSNIFVEYLRKFEAIFDKALCICVSEPGGDV
jgi:hypothetical protein